MEYAKLVPGSNSRSSSPKIAIESVSERYDRVRLGDAATWTNQSLSFTRALGDMLLLAEVSPELERPELLARARAASERLANPYRELDVSLTSLRLGLGDPMHASDDYVALEELSDRAERLSARRHMGLCLLAQAEVLAPHDLRGALDHARLGETQLRVLGAKLEADRAARLIARLTAR